MSSDGRNIAVELHPRSYRENLYIYPVLSRRARGISIGVNLNPDKVCNFDCVYCQVDWTTPPRVAQVDEPRLLDELRTLLLSARSGVLLEREEFRRVPPEFRMVRDLCFAGDGEPPAYPRFLEVVTGVLRIKHASGFPDLKVIVLTNATLIHRPRVQDALRLLDRDHGELWLKLDAGTEEYYRRIDRTTIPLARVLTNILEAARARPIVLQSLFMKVHGQPPPSEEIAAYGERVKEILDAGGQVRTVQIYTVSRTPAEPFVTPLGDAELDVLAGDVRRRLSGAVPVETFYSSRLG